MKCTNAKRLRKCSACDKEQEESEYDRDNLENSKKPDRTDKLICKPCLNLGYSSRDTSPYKCDGCGQDRGHTAYPQKGVRCCDECLKTKARCSKCNEWKNIAAEKWKAGEVKNTKRGVSKLLCVPCRASGITKRSRDLFECVGCAYHTRGKAELGREHFEKKSIEQCQNKGRSISLLEMRGPRRLHSGKA